LWKSHWTDQDLGLLDTAKALGLAVLEISLGDDVQFDRQRVRRWAQALGLELTGSPGNLWPADCNISDDDPANRCRGVAWHKKLIEQAAELGASSYCGAIYSRPGHVCRRRPPPEELPRTAEHLCELAEHGRAHGIKVVIEPMSRFRVHLVNTAQQAAELVGLAGHPNLGINLDSYHMITEERDYGAAIDKVAPLLWGLHACENDRGVPGGGLVPWVSVFDALVRVKGCTRIMLETYNTGPGGFGFSRGIFQNLCPSGDDFVKRGIAFLRQCAISAAEERLRNKS